MELARVHLVGAQRFSPDQVAQLAGLTIGKTVTVEDLNAAAQRLANTGFFDAVKYRYTVVGGRASVVYEIQEAPWTIPVTFDNFVWFTKEELVAAVRQDVATFDGTLPKSQEMPDRVIAALQKLLTSRKIPGRVTFAPEAKLGSGEILQYLFGVSDPAPRLCSVRVSGAAAIPEAELVEAVQKASGTDYSGFSIGNLVKGTLTNMYRRRGFWRASFAAPSVTLTETESCSGVALTLAVSEGPPYAFAGTQWSGNASIPAPKLDAVFDLRPADLADIDKVEAGLRAARREYGRIGHLAMRSSYTPRLDDASQRVTFEIQVTEGPQFRMGKFEVVGLTSADVEVLTRKWRLQPGDVFDEEYLREFETKEVSPLWRARRAAGKPPQMQTQVDSKSLVVNVRIVAG